MEEIVYVVSDGREIFGVCYDKSGLNQFLKHRAARITSDISIDLRLDDPEPKAVVRYYASSDSSWLYNYPIKRMPLVRGSRAR